MPLLGAAVLCGIALSAGFLVPPQKEEVSVGVFGGPVSFSGIEDGGVAEVALAAAPAIVGTTNGDDIVPPYLGGADELYGVTLAASGAIFGGITAQGGVVSYVVQKGDTLSGIAKEFGVSVETILGANPGLNSRRLKVGQEVTILSVSGILYQVREGETPESVASSFGLSLAQLREFNRSTDFSVVGTGSTLLIPGARPSGTGRGLYGDLPRITGYFTTPTKGFNWGRLHSYNAVDIANTCGTEVAAAAEGLVVPDKIYGSGVEGWNGGYGIFVLIEHPNGTKTRYSHLESAAVQIGEYVSQNQTIGAIGNTGNVHGPTGCHLHVEVYGAQNQMLR